MQSSGGSSREHDKHAHPGQHVMPDGMVMDGAHHEHGHHAHAPAAGKAACQGDPDQAEYTCPMHPEVRQLGPGSCPNCGMALEPVLVTADQGESPELRDMTRRFWIGTALTVAGLRAGDGRPPHRT